MLVFEVAVTSSKDCKLWYTINFEFLDPGNSEIQFLTYKDVFLEQQRGQVRIVGCGHKFHILLRPKTITNHHRRHPD
jgi:hypothetical protein